MTKTTYLIVKTGRSGAKVNDCYDASIVKDGKTIRLSGEYRLQGSWYRAITKAVKSKGITGTLSVFKHSTEDADALIASHNRTLLLLKNNLDWQPVARIDHDDIEAVVERARREAWLEFERAGLIKVNRRNRNGFMTNYSLPDEQMAHLKELAGGDTYSKLRVFNNMLKVEFKKLQRAADELAEYAVVPLVETL